MASVNVRDEWVDDNNEWADDDGEWTDDEAPTAAISVADRSVADTARTRLSRRGLTPEKIKADPSLSITRPGQIRRRSPKTTDRGFLGELGGALNPVEIAGSLASDWGRGLLSSVATPFLQSDDPSVDPADNYQPHVPQLVPDLPAIYQEATRRGSANESLAGMYGSAAGQALLAGGGAAASKLIRGAPARAAAAEAEYTDFTGAHGPTFGPKPIAREMLDRGLVVSANPAEQAATHRARVTAINTERAAIPGSKAVRGPKGLQSSTDPVDVANATKRAELKTQAEVEANIAQILETLPETRTALGAIGKGAGGFAKSRWTMASGLVGTTAGWSPASMLTLGPVAATHLLWSISKELVKTNQWQTAAPIYKMRFANALMTGDANLAAATGALIANGQAATSNEQGEVREATGPTSTASTASTTPASKLQVLSGASGAPGTLPSQTPRSPQSPQSPRLPRRKPNTQLINTGMDEFEYAVTPQARRIMELERLMDEGPPVTTGPSGTGGEAFDIWARFTGPLERERNALVAEVRSKGTPHENNRLYNSTSINDLFPKMFTHVHKTFGASSEKADKMYQANAVWGTKLNDWDAPDDVGGNDTIITAGRFSTNPFNVLHEYGHSIWHKELTAAEKEDWEDIHYDYVEGSEGGLPAPAAVRIYEEDPGHAYASLVAHYMLNPKAFSKRYPDAYNFIKRTFGGVQYLGGKITGGSRK